MSNQISYHHLYYGDNLSILQEYVPDESVNLIYIDPPFNTGKLQQRTEIKVEPDAQGDRVGFQGKTYRTRKVKTIYYSEIYNYFDTFVEQTATLRPLPHKLESLCYGNPAETARAGGPRETPLLPCCVGALSRRAHIFSEFTIYG